MAPASARTLPEPGPQKGQNTVDITSVAPVARPHTRELRALALVQARGHEIVRTGPWTYLVPSCSGGEPYAVN